MKTFPLTAIAGVAAASALMGSTAGCHNDAKAPAPSSEAGNATSTGHTTAPPQPTMDYTKLLIRAEDIDAPEQFTASPAVANPNGQQGAATTFSDDDGSHIIRDTIVILPDPAAAANALDAAKSAPPGSISGTPKPANVGAGGTTISGDLPDKSKGVTVLLFTEGKAFVTLEFDGPTGMEAPPEFVTAVGQKQDTAIKNGLHP
ncbi:hypothetical protein [Mycobacterium shimoidei]|uniref:Lipoprotein LpqN n=1 Tax=Mycobacterium shimoidei TaxID=29313 RepID=A0A1E3TFB7_MYCSH|nr:hypothetical protein [Mycobacterium shimoidei]MCV7261274.1 hypothetical protein [Mycobacterium shimoidei]ODR13140.1 hypothetical protein BHQ16_11675 [Mycobacterium shimoidei]ORW78511.1 hypothetical protein AWC26_17620 [Mycobacterium shimoidei]SRX94768.1 hypothetical protein MSP7336_03029 [Mycobacterium shimoidei]